VKLVDSHCHLDDEKFAGDRDAVIERAQAAGVERLMAIGTGDGPADLETAVRLADRYPFFYATVGVHPHDAAKATEETFPRLRDLLPNPKVLALGEIGLDYHYDFSPRDIQRNVFVRQLELAREARKPIVIHTREAWADTMQILREHYAGAGIFHCFTGGPAEAQEGLDFGFHLSFGGVLTFPKAEAVREAARLAPLDRLLVETDAPYLAPVPHRGKRNEPAFLVETARKLAEIRGIPPEELAALTTRNFERLCLRYTG
jgi:TatD DNase family protein